MNAITALLLGLSTLTFADGDSESIDSVDWDSADTNSDGGDTSYNGIKIRVFQENEESPTIALGTSLDDLENIYCLKFVGFYESEDYNTTVSQDASNNAVAGSQISLDDAGCDIKNVTASTFQIICNNVNKANEANDGYLSLKFQFTQDDEGDYGLEYTVILGDYQWTSNDPAAKLVMVQSVMECSDALNITDTDTDTDADTEGTVRRLLQDTDDSSDDDDDDDEGSEDENSEDDDESGDEESTSDESTSGSNSADESAGISSDDSGEFDDGNVRFVLNGQAYDQCDVATNGDAQTAVASKLVYQTAAQELHIVFDHFNCDLYQDPRFLIDESKVTGENEDQEDGDSGVTGVMAVLMGFVAAVWAL